MSVDEDQGREGRGGVEPNNTNNTNYNMYYLYCTVVQYLSFQGRTGQDVSSRKTWRTCFMEIPPQGSRGREGLQIQTPTYRSVPFQNPLPVSTTCLLQGIILNNKYIALILLYHH